MWIGFFPLLFFSLFPITSIKLYMAIKSRNFTPLSCLHFWVDYCRVFLYFSEERKRSQRIMFFCMFYILSPFHFLKSSHNQEDLFHLSTPWSCNLHVPLINPLIHHQIPLALYLLFGFWILIINLCTRDFCPASWCLEAWPLDPFNKLLGTKHISKPNHILMIYFWSNISMLFVALHQLWSRISKDLPSKILV